MSAEFIDSLAVMLLALGMTTAIGGMYFLFSALGNEKRIEGLLMPAVGVGLFDFMSGFVMSFTWPLPSSYNMLFGDPLLMAGLLLMISAIAYYKHYDISSVSILLFFLGIYVIIEAVGIVNYHLESGDNLLAAMGLYIVDGIAAILSPIMYIDQKKGKIAYMIEAAILIIGTLIALFIGYTAIYGHLLDFIKYFP
ncbi:conserved hypothetical membrane protein [Thermoplasma acidophilum]|uniref:Conserved hypothetical membrane protein n=1 Tax=Thermoplasma acidophilum (strain ATCC 25905 / DSM 1728 / JCM 9062 / NBRC 15155 / AMRC-C165) TaxID=273075 RepID=Q9HJ04_THEAC|nr:DUF981 family protein [Thermoplasma acidophilum]MCY0852129.1 DUF981 family protein [Thermoplasma acidophilum]CAC12297.1 conserved hypothetical membrane protein [Thermoplasma acidophilum]